ncbi:MAG: hypothetical protein ABI134_32045 [Byssovorax sp.]
MRTALLLTIFALFSAPAAGNAADPPPHIAIRLAYDQGPGVEGCPDERGFRYELMGAFGYDPTEPSQIADFEAPPLLRVVISREGAQLRAVASEVNAAGRVLWGGEYQDRIDCPTLARNIALVIRVGIGVDAGPTRQPTPLSPPPMLPPVVAAIAPSKPPPVAPPSPKVRLGAGSALAFGVAPAAAVGFSMQLGLRWPDVSLSFEGRADLPAESEELEIRTSMLSGTLLPCVHVWTYGAACGLLTLGALRSTWLEGTSPTSHASNLYLGVGARLGLEVPFAGRWAVRLGGELVVAAVPTIVGVGLGNVERWRSAPISGGPTLGLLMNFDGP